MQRQKMISSKIKFVGYYPLEKILEIGFVNSSTFQYVGVPQSIYNSFLAVQSKGRFFNDGYEVDENSVLWDINLLCKWTPTTGSNKNDFQELSKSSFLESSGFTTQEFTFNNAIKETTFRLYC